MADFGANVLSSSVALLGLLVIMGLIYTIWSQINMKKKQKYFKADQIDRSQLDVFKLLRAEGIGVNLHYIPVYSQPYYRKHAQGQGEYPNADRYYAEAISLPMFPTMTECQQDQVIAAIRKALQS